MARTPRAHVPATSGQGVSRLSYQLGYAMRPEGPRANTKFAKVAAPKREYGKGKAEAKKAPSYNISYGDTHRIGDLKDIEAFPKR